MKIKENLPGVSECSSIEVREKAIDSLAWTLVVPSVDTRDSVVYLSALEHSFPAH